MKWKILSDKEEHIEWEGDPMKEDYFEEVTPTKTVDFDARSLSDILFDEFFPSFKGHTKYLTTTRLTLNPHTLRQFSMARSSFMTWKQRTLIRLLNSATSKW